MWYKSKSNSGRPQDDLPYEYRMKYVIEDYLKNLEMLEKLKKYAHTLELRLEEETDKRKEMGAKNKKLGEVGTQRNRKCKALMARCIWLQDRIKEIKLYCDNNEPVPDELWPKDVNFEEEEDKD